MQHFWGGHSWTRAIVLLLGCSAAFTLVFFTFAGRLTLIPDTVPGGLSLIPAPVVSRLIEAVADEYQRVPVPGSAEVVFTRHGLYTIFVEFEGNPPGPESDWYDALTVSHTAPWLSGEPELLLVNPATGTAGYHLRDSVGIPVRDLLVQSGAPVTLTISSEFAGGREGDPDAVLAVGPNITAFMSRSIVLGVAVVATIAVLLLAAPRLVRHRRLANQRRQRGQSNRERYQTWYDSVSGRDK